MSKKRFTLVELLVVCVVIIVAAVVFCCMLSASRKKHAAYMMNCTNNLQQLKIALQAYADDYRSFMPDKSDWQGMAQLMQFKYLEDGKNLICQETKDTREDDWQQLDDSNCSYTYKGGLYINELSPDVVILSDKTPCHNKTANTMTIGD